LPHLATRACAAVRTMPPAACIPWWYNSTTGFAGCPYGRRLPGDVTLPDHASFMDWSAVVYSYIPFIVPVAVFAELLITRGTRQLSVLLFTGMTTLGNEILVKQLMSQPRPGALGPAPGLLTNIWGIHVGSCNITCGMPSSHSTMAIGFLMLTMFDGIIRIIPDTASLSQDWDVNTYPSIWKSFSVTPLSPKPVMYTLEFLGFFSVWMILLCPVPLMRVQLNDHSAEQVCLGSLLGVVYAMIWFQIMRCAVYRYRDLFGKKICGGLLLHNYGPVAFRVMARPPSRYDEEWQVLQWDAKLVDAKTLQNGEKSTTEDEDST